MTNAEALAIILEGFFLPFIVSLIKRPDWPKRGKIALAVGGSLVAGLATAYVSNSLILSWERVLVDVALVLVASQGMYRLWFERSIIEERLRAL